MFIVAVTVCNNVCIVLYRLQLKRWFQAPETKMDVEVMQ